MLRDHHPLPQLNLLLSYLPWPIRGQYWGHVISLNQPGIDGRLRHQRGDNTWTNGHWVMRSAANLYHLCFVQLAIFLFVKKEPPFHALLGVIKWNCLTFCSCCFNIGLNKKICSQSPRAAWRWVTCDQILERNKSFFNENNGKGFKMLKHWRFKNLAIRDPKSFNYVARTWNWLFCRSGLLVPMYLSEEEKRGTTGRQFQRSQDLFDSFYPSLLSKPSLSRWLTDEDKNFMS